MERSVWVGKMVMFAVVAVCIAFGVVMGTMYLWNWVIPEVFNGPVINFWQTLGLLALSKIFFGTLVEDVTGTGVILEVHGDPTGRKN
ncbi:MAG: hypothetical protein IPJ20_09725 [Flammeovirgaceae bacterium]|nr:hypothetical protein [Flammeovirgaceae bacterium]